MGAGNNFGTWLFNSDGRRLEANQVAEEFAAKEGLCPASSSSLFSEWWLAAADLCLPA
jgi:hypothetical protein